MSSAREKLIEIWLDNATERQYQFAFRNALLFSGNTILHDTSHTALELGKDIIARAPSGEINAYQLKGNPGGRLTISQWQQLIAQIDTLVYQPVSHPSVKAGTAHQPYLVTNGEIHEDVYAAIAAYNNHLAASAPRLKPLKTIARGELLQTLLESADTLWPADVPTQRNILNIYAAPGDDEIPRDEFVSILGTALSGKYSSAAIPAAHLVTAVLAANWIAKENYFEVVKMYSLLSVSAICYQARWRVQRRKDRAFIDEIIFDIRSHLRSLINELYKEYNGRPLVNWHVFEEFGYYHERKKMISYTSDRTGLEESHRPRPYAPPPLMRARRHLGSRPLSFRCTHDRSGHRSRRAATRAKNRPADRR